jgi:hypothetical protein
VRQTEDHDTHDEHGKGSRRSELRMENGSKRENACYQEKDPPVIVRGYLHSAGLSALAGRQAPSFGV